MLKMTEDEYTEACDDNLGLCTKCWEIADMFCEPDAKKYKCPNCDAMAVQGMENALIVGNIEFVDESVSAE
jgi:Zn finger protein HypA/HybF involved in hydrogenase expression